MRTPLLFFVIVFTFNLSISSCQNMKSKSEKEKFSWLATISAPQEYPIEVYKGSLIASDFTYSFDVIWGTKNPGWGNTGGTMSTDTEAAFAPHTLQFTWYAINEKKFYTGNWALDSSKIEALFKAGIANPGSSKKGAYEQFIIGLAPGGSVTLWLSGPGSQVTVGHFLAKDTIISKEEAYENAEYMFSDNYAISVLSDPMIMRPDVAARIARLGLPNANVYEQFEKPYTWLPNITISNGYNIKSIEFFLANGENFNISQNEIETRFEKSVAIPYLINILYFNPSKKEGQAILVFTNEQNYLKTYYTKGNITLPVDFDQSSILKLFQQHKETGKLELLIKIDPEKESLSAGLKAGSEEIPIKNYIGKIFQD